MADENPFEYAARMPQTQRASGTGLGFYDSVFTDRPTNEGLQGAMSADKELRKRGQEDQAAQDDLAQRNRIMRLGEVYKKQLSATNDPQLAMKAVIGESDFFMAGDGTQAGFLKTIGEVQKIAFPDPEKPTILSPGQQAFVGGVKKFENTATTGKETQTDKEIAKRTVGNFNKVAEAGEQARMDELAVNQLEALGDKIGTGGAAAIKSYLGRVGIATEGIDGIQAYDALIARLTPAQRQGLPGSASNLDVQMFRDALPKLINQPGGNKLITSTFKAMVQDRIARAQIVEDFYSGNYTVPEALKAMRGLPNPLERFKTMKAEAEATRTKGSARGASRNTGAPVGEMSTEDIQRHIEQLKGSR